MRTWAWEQRASQLRRQIETEDLHSQAAEQVATMAAEAVAALDLQGRRWCLERLGFRMVIGCEDWSQKGPDRRYRVSIEWAGSALVGSTTDYVPSLNARCTYTAIWSRVTTVPGW